MTDADILGFLTTMGREFCAVLRSEAGILDASGHDCYSATVAALGTPVGPDELSSLKPEQLAHIADAFNAYFETTTVTPSHVAAAISATLRHWS
jgi:hypothetical protein